MQLSIRDIAQRVDAQVRGECKRQIDDVAPLTEAEATHITFLESAKELKKADQSAAGAVLITEELAERLPECKATLLIVGNPFAAFIQVMELFRPVRKQTAVGISSEAHVDPTARIASGTCIHPTACVGARAQIGENCLILPGAVIGEDVVIGNNCVIHPHAVLYPGVQLSERVIIHANAVIGADGFGYRFVAGRFERIPHRGNVIIENDVEIGACTTVDRGMIGPTVIGQGTKLDNLVMIAHNCRVGRHNAFASQVGLAGSVTTGDYVRAGGQVGVADHVTIGSQVSFGGKAGVITDVPSGETYHGIPAGPEKEEIRRLLTLRKAPQVFEQIKQLQKQVNALQAQLATLSDSGSESAAA
ncbi:MAG: UDP-3-O-(3-hydroxymyristoyl)glucosamine N-acyltransferase [Planctomycetaceae bacterium]